MIVLSRLLHGLAAAMRLAVFDSRGLAALDGGPAAFWFGFVVVVFASILVGLATMAILGEAFALRPFLIGAIAEIATLGGFALIMIAITRTIDREYEYMLYMTAHFWLSAVLGTGLSLVLGIVVARAGEPNAAVVQLGLPLLIWVTAAHVFLARRALRVPLATSIAIVAFEMIFVLAIRVLARAMAERGSP